LNASEREGLCPNPGSGGFPMVKFGALGFRLGARDAATRA
jgi:hypothetical protein